MAAFEKVSDIFIQQLDSKEDVIDIRGTELPFFRPVVKDDFDPRLERHPSHPIEPWMAYFNLLRASFGAGMLGVPLAMSQAGILFGPILILAIGFVLVHTHMMLLWCLNEMCRQLRIPMLPYRYGFRLALLHGPPILHGLGNIGPAIVALFMILSQLGICSVQIIFTADNIRDIMDWPSADVALLYMIGPIFIFELIMKNLTMISKVVMTANCLNFIATVLVMIQVFRAPVREVYLMPLGWTSLLLAVGIMLFNMSAVGVILSCEKALENPKLMYGVHGIVFVGLMVPTIVCVVVGVLGYWYLGIMEENILRYLPYDETLTMVAFGFYVASTGLSFPLACYPAVEIIVELFKNHDPRVKLGASTVKGIEFVGRPIFLIATFACAYFFPFQAPYVAFVGSLCTTIVSVVFPALMEIGLCYPSHYGRYNYILIKDIILALVGLTVFFSGISHCGYLMYIRIQSKLSPMETNYDPDIIILEEAHQHGPFH